ncbi:MAG: NrtA/SsuA/CpmA family ABC transporter substrate-binding protein [Clostridiales bacterium]
MKKLLTIILILCLLLSLALTGCSSSNPQPPAGATAPAQNSESTAPANNEEPLKVTIGTWKTAQTITPYFYQDFSEGKLTAEVLPFTNPGDQKTALLAGSLDMCGTTIVSAILAAANDEPVVIVAGLCNKCSALVAASGSGIESGADLKGKRIAYVPGTMHHILLLDVLRQNNLDPDKDVTLKRIDFFDMGTALAGGEIDAFCSGEPYPTIAQLEGYGKIISYPYFDDSIGTINAAMIVTKKMAQEQPEKVQALVNAHVAATHGLNADRELWLGKAAEFGSDPAVLEAAADNIELFYDIDEAFLAHTAKLAEEMLSLGLIDKIPDIDAMFDLTFLNNAKK